MELSKKDLQKEFKDNGIVITEFIMRMDLAYAIADVVILSCSIDPLIF